MKRFVICLVIILLVVLGVSFYKYKTNSVECWWGVVYPQLSYIAFKDEDTKVSSSDTDYFYIDNKIKVKWAIWEWIKSSF